MEASNSGPSLTNYFVVHLGIIIIGFDLLCGQTILEDMSEDIRLPRIAQRPEDFTLWSACFDGDEGSVEDCIAENPESIFDADDVGNTALHYSLARSSLRTATAVLMVPLEACPRIPKR